MDLEQSSRIDDEELWCFTVDGIPYHRYGDNGVAVFRQMFELIDDHECEAVGFGRCVWDADEAPF